MHRLFVLACGLVALVACGTSRKAQLERVAKDWSETIRASQIIPVYPLTEDLQPGDVFLVQRTVDEQHEAYEGAGFLPFDNHLGRIDPTGYESFYERSFGVGGPGKPLPSTWLTSDPLWKDSPTAAFPTYTFSTSRGGSLSLALPISGIPVGLSLLGAKSAAGTVTIADARTYGVDAESLHLDVRAWAARRRDFLKTFGSNERRNYLRVVCRVYLTGRVNVSVQASRTFAGGVSAGAPTPAELLTSSTGENAETAYTGAVAKLNETLEGLREAGKGGTLKVAAASARSISLEETFERPLVIGYLGFDMQIREGGRLGPPIPTHAVLERGVPPEARGVVLFTADQAAYDRALRKAREKSADFYRQCLEMLDPALGEGYNPGDRPYAAFKKALGEWRRSAGDEEAKNVRMHDATRVILEELAREGS